MFQDALPAVEGAIRRLAPATDEIGKSLMDRMVSFTNDFTAVTSTFAIDAGQAGRDLSRLLQAGRGGAGMDNMTFMRMMPFLKQVEGQANLTAESFNRMTEPERLRILREGLEQLNPMIEAAGNTWDAQTGALASNARMLTRLATAPFFEMMKSSLGDINGALMTTEGTLTPLGQTIVDIGKNVSTYLAGGFTRVADVVKGLTTHLGEMANFVQSSPAFAAILRIGDTIRNTLGTAVDAGTNVVEGASGGAAGVLDRVMGVINSLAGIFETLSSAVAPAISLMATYAGLMLDMVSGLSGMAQGVQMIVTPLIQFAMGLADIVVKRFGEMRPHLQKLFDAVGRLGTAIGTVLNPLIRLLSTVFTWLYDKLSGFLIPIFNLLIDTLTFVIDKLGDLLTWIGEQVGGDNARTIAGAGAGREEEETGLVFNATPPSTEAADAATARPTPAGRGGGNTVQDFRYSRFDIQQKFDEGFDPDRIAVAFATDLGRVGAQRLESGFQPLFGLR